MKTKIKSRVLWLALCLFNADAAELKPPRPDLTGIVRVKGGEPLKDAAVFIYTAGPRFGAGFL